ncbi:MAG: helix-turn-helix domain-containing protein [Moorellaceae bacterium]
MLTERLRKLREQAGLTQEELAKLLGVERSTISRYESGNRDPSSEMLDRLAKFFNVSVDYLLGRTDDPRTIEQINEEAQKKIEEALEGDEELLSFWQELRQREDLQLLFKQVKPLSPVSIRKIIRVIKAIEDEEAMES